MQVERNTNQGHLGLVLFWLYHIKYSRMVLVTIWQKSLKKPSYIKCICNIVFLLLAAGCCRECCNHFLPWADSFLKIKKSSGFFFFFGLCGQYVGSKNVALSTQSSLHAFISISHEQQWAKLTYWSVDSFWFFLRLVLWPRAVTRLHNSSLWWSDCWFVWRSIRATIKNKHNKIRIKSYN